MKEREFCRRDQPRRWLYRGLSVRRGKKAFRIDLGYLQAVLFSSQGNEMIKSRYKTLLLILLG